MSVIEEREEEAAILEERLTCLESTVAELAELIREQVHGRGDPMSAICGICGRKVRVTKHGSLAKHASHYATACDNTGVVEDKIRTDAA